MSASEIRAMAKANPGKEYRVGDTTIMYSARLGMFIEYTR